jgi:hypothetical protein
MKTKLLILLSLTVAFAFDAHAGSVVWQRGNQVPNEQ